MNAFSHVRPDGVTVTLGAPRWRLELRDERNKLIEAPQDWLVEHASGARLVTLRKCAEPLALDAALAADVLAAVDALARPKPGERAAIERALREGRPVTLKGLLRAMDGRRMKSARGLIGVATADTRALCDRVQHAERSAVAALDPALVARLDAWMAGARAN